jgi:hypothetical protein
MLCICIALFLLPDYQSMYSTCRTEYIQVPSSSLPEVNNFAINVQAFLNRARHYGNKIQSDMLFFNCRRIVVIQQRPRTPSMVPVVTTHSINDYGPLEEYGYPGNSQSSAGVPAYKSTAVQPSAPHIGPQPPSYEESVRPSTSGLRPVPRDNPPPYAPK